VKAITVSVVPGLLTVKVKRTPARIPSQESGRTRKGEA